MDPVQESRRSLLLAPLLAVLPAALADTASASPLNPAQTIIQLHGGMGMTQELPATRLNKRLMMVEFEYGDAAWHARQLLRAA